MNQRTTLISSLLASSVLALSACETNKPLPLTDTGTDTGVRDTSVADTGARDASNDSAHNEDGHSHTGDTGPSDAAADGGTASCQAYCTGIMTACTGGNSQYGDMASCLGVCASFPPGMVSDTAGNTLGCRSYHLSVAAQSSANAITHCPHAGPLGDGTCGGSCESFCSINAGVCGTTVYATNEACISACGGFATTPAYSSAVVDGDSLACRMYHLTVASTGTANRNTHCPHTLANSSTCN